MFKPNLCQIYRETSEREITHVYNSYLLCVSVVFINYAGVAVLLILQTQRSSGTKSILNPVFASLWNMIYGLKKYISFRTYFLLLWTQFFKEEGLPACTFCQCRLYFFIIVKIEI